MELEDMRWREMWTVICDYLSLHKQKPQMFPLHENFWGYRRVLGERTPRKSMLQEILDLGLRPRRVDVNSLVGYGPGDTDTWLRRRVRYIKDAESRA